MSTSGGDIKTNGIMKFIQDMLDLLNWYNDVPYEMEVIPSGVEGILHLDDG